ESCRSAGPALLGRTRRDSPLHPRQLDRRFPAAAVATARCSGGAGAHSLGVAARREDGGGHTWRDSLRSAGAQTATRGGLAALCPGVLRLRSGVVELARVGAVRCVRPLF